MWTSLARTPLFAAVWAGRYRVERRTTLAASLEALEQSSRSLREELAVTEPLVAKGAAGHLEVVRLRRTIAELNAKSAETRNQYTVKASEELAKASAELESLSQIQIARTDSVARTTLHSPVRGIVKDVQITTADGVLAPGGWAPDKLRRDEHVLRLVREVHEAGGLVATICHGPWILISAGIVRGRILTGSRGIRDDLVNAGAEWRDEPVVVDGNIVSARVPKDLPEFGVAMVDVLAGL